jgi:hypothetical protein
MSIRLEKVAALRRLFAEYGYAPISVDGGMDKEAANRLTKFMNRAGPEKFNKAWGRALERGSDAIHSKVLAYAMQPYNMQRKPVDVDKYNKLHDKLFKKMRAAQSARDRWAEGDQLSRFMHHSDIVRTGEKLRKARNDLSRLFMFNPDAIQTDLDVRNKTAERYQDWMRTLIDPKQSRRPGERMIYTPYLDARYMGRGDTPSVNSVVSDYMTQIPPAVLPVRRSALSREIMEATAAPRLSKLRMRELSNGLVDPWWLLWHAQHDPTGRILGRDTFLGKKKFVATRPAASIPYGVLKPHTRFREETKYLPKDMFAGVMQVKKSELMKYLNRILAGSSKLNSPVAGPHLARHSLTDGVEAIIAKRRKLRGMENQGIRRTPGMLFPEISNIPDYELVADEVDPGGFYTYILGGHGDVFDARASDMRRVRAQNNKKRVDRRYEQMLNFSPKLSDMVQRGYFTLADVRRFLTDPGVKLDIQPDSGNWPQYLRSLGGGAYTY